MTTTRAGRLLFVLLTGCACCRAQAVVLSVLNAASYSGYVAPGTWVAIFGTNLAPAATAAAITPLPTQLGGVSVSIAGFPAPLNYVSPGQINAVVPFEVPIPTTLAGIVPVIVTTPAGASAPFNIHVSQFAPALFTQNGAGTGPVFAFDANFKQVAESSNNTIILYAAGLGLTEPAGSSAGGGISAPPYNLLLDPVTVFVGDTQATVDFQGLAPGLPGIYQLNVTPNGPLSDRVYLQQGIVWQSNVTSLPTATGGNVANVTGSIDGLYPATGANLTKFGTGASVSAPVASSSMLMAADFSTAFDILPGAKPFSVVATTEAATEIIQINPGLKTWQATVTVPTIPARNYNFSALPPFVYDFPSCSPSQGCLPFPNNIIPESRLDPIALQALALLPAPNTATISAFLQSFVMLSGNLTGTHFDTSQIGIPTNFGAFLQIPETGTPVRNTNFNLYVDGTLVTGKTASYPVFQQ